LSNSLARASDVRGGHVLSGFAAAVCIVAPLVALASLRSPAVGVTPSSPWIALTNPVLRQILLASAARAALAAAIAGGCGLGLGVALATVRSSWARAGAVLHLLPLCLPPYLLALGVVHGLARGGPLDTAVGASLRSSADSALHGPWGFVAIQVLALTPLVTLLVLTAVRGMDPSPVEAAALARGPFAALTRVVARHALPAAGAGATLVFLLTLGEVAVPTLLGVQTYAGTVFARLADLSFLPGEALSRSLPLVLLALAGTAVLLRLDRGGAVLPTAQSGRGPAAESLGRGTVRTTGLVTAGLAAMTPLLGLVWMAASGPDPFSALGPALGSAGWTVLYVTGAAVPLVGLGLLGGHAWARDPGRQTLSAGAALLGLALPAVVLGIGLIALWNRPATTWIYGGAAVVLLGLGGRYLYVAQRAFKVVFDAIPAAEEEAAWIARPGILSRWRWVMVPRVGRATWMVLAAVALLCLRDLDTILAIYPPGGETLAVRILTLEANAPPAQTATLALLQVALSAVLGVAVLARVARRRLR